MTRRLLEALLYAVMVGGATVSVLWAQDTQKPDPLATCNVELERLRAYATILKGDRDQKEAALADYDHRVRALTAELAKLKESSHGRRD